MIDVLELAILVWNLEVAILVWNLEVAILKVQLPPIYSLVER